MKFKFAPKGDYHPRQIITIAGVKYTVLEVAHTGRSLIASTVAAPIQRINVILTDAKPTEEIPVPKGYTADELDRDNPYNQWMHPMSNIIPFTPPKPPAKHSVCSFCKTPKHKVKNLVATETHAICDVCLAQATQRLKDSE